MSADQRKFCDAALDVSPLEKRIILDVLSEIKDPNKKEKLFTLWARRLSQKSCGSRVGTKRGIDHDIEAATSVSMMLCHSGQLKKTPSALRLKLCGVLLCVEGRTIILREIEGEVF